MPPIGDLLTDSVADKFWDLAELAYRYLLNFEFVFSNVPDDLIELGFLQSFPRKYSHKDASSCHSFLHLTIQEYLTALHASTNFFLMMMIDYSVKYCFPNVAIFLAGLTHVPVQNLTIDSAYHDDIIPSMFELQSAKEINDIIQMSLSSNHPLICNIRNPIMVTC